MLPPVFEIRYPNFKIHGFRFKVQNVTPRGLVTQLSFREAWRLPLSFRGVPPFFVIPSVSEGSLTEFATISRLSSPLQIPHPPSVGFGMTRNGDLIPQFVRNDKGENVIPGFDQESMPVRRKTPQPKNFKRASSVFDPTIFMPASLGFLGSIVN